MLEDKIRATDFEATNDAIEEQVAHESYLQWLRDNEKRSKSQVRLINFIIITSVDDGIKNWLLYWPVMWICSYTSSVSLFVPSLFGSLGTTVGTYSLVESIKMTS